jgi:hypothetical protein
MFFPAITEGQIQYDDTGKGLFPSDRLREPTPVAEKGEMRRGPRLLGVVEKGQDRDEAVLRPERRRSGHLPSGQTNTSD